MSGSLQSPPVIVRGSRRRGVLLLVGSAVFVAGGALEIAQGKTQVGIGTIAFFGLCGMIGLWTVIARPWLEIAPSGITQRILWQTRQFGWADIYNFRATTIGLTNRTVGFDYLKPRPGREGLRKFNVAVTGVQGSLGQGWEIDTASLAALLNQAREQWLDATAGPAPTVAAVRAQSAPGGLAGARLNRKTYLLAAAVLFAIAVGLGLIPGIAHGAGSVGTVFFIWLYNGRLHDMGRSGWWQTTLYAVQIALAVAMIVIGGQWVAVSTLAIVLLQLIFTIGLGIIPGQKGANRFGPAPGEPTLAEQVEVFR